MGEPVFLKRGAGLSWGEVAGLAGAELPDGAPFERRIFDVAPLDRAGPAHLAFYDHRRSCRAAAATHAGVCLTSAALAKELPAAVVKLIVGEPYRAFVTVARALFPQALHPSTLGEGGTAAGAHIAPSARLEDNVTVEPGAAIGPRAEIGGGTTIGANAVIGADVRIGRDCAIGPNAAIQHALIGDRVIVHAGCMIGQDGFGFVMGASGHLKVPQLGRVIIQDNVEIGAGTAIDRGALCDTVIGEGTKIDNLVQVGHNVSIGRHCVVVAQSGISGSTTIEDFAVLGGGAGVTHDVAVGQGARMVARSGVHADVPASEPSQGK